MLTSKKFKPILKVETCLGVVPADKKYRFEKQLQRKAGIEIKKVYNFNVWYYHAREGKGGRKGILDIILCFYGLFVVIELKRDLSVDGLKKLQTHNIKLIQRAGGIAFSADTVAGVMQGLARITRSQRFRRLIDGQRQEESNDAYR